MESEVILPPIQPLFSPLDSQILPQQSQQQDPTLLQEPAASTNPPPSPSASSPIVLTDDLRDKIIRQVEYYFSDENLPTDKFLMNYVKKDKKGFVLVGVIGSFRKMKKLCQDNSLIVAALKESSQLVLSSNGNKVKRINPLPVTDDKDANTRTVFVENLPDDFSKENLQKIFANAGHVKNICIRDPNATEESTKATKVEMGISGKLHALVEYETVKEAEKAVATLNDENNWRSGLRVEPLLKRMGKYGLGKRSWKGNAPEKNNNGRTTDSSGDKKDAKSNDHTDEIPEQEEAAHSPSEKIERRGRNQGRSRGHKHQNMNGHGHGYVSSVLGSEGINRAPPPGPRMPDGTRGFAIGRGQPPLSNHT